jgi:hypothetical protein
MKISEGELIKIHFSFGKLFYLFFNQLLEGVYSARKGISFIISPINSSSLLIVVVKPLLAVYHATIFPLIPCLNSIETFGTLSETLGTFFI